MLSNTGPTCPTNDLKSLTWFTNKESKLHINPQHQPFQYLLRDGDGTLIILSKVMMSQWLDSRPSVPHFARIP